MKFSLTSWDLFKKLIGPQLLIIFFALFFSFIVSSYYFKQYVLTSTKNEVFRNLNIIEKILLTRNRPLDQWCQIIQNSESQRLTIIDSKGKVFCDNIENNIEENHLNRNEIIQAQKKNIGTSIRYSNTLKKNMLYGAIKIKGPKDGDHYYIRIALPLKGINNLISQIQFSIFILLVPIFLILSFLSLWFKISSEDNENKKNKQIKNDLMANISHEVRTPLTALKGYVQVLTQNKDNLPVQLHNYLDKIESNCERLTMLFRDILDLSVLENNTELFFEVLDIKELTLSIVNSIKDAHKEKNISVQIEMNIDEIEGDAKTIVQLINNLVDNAFKYTSKNGSIYILWERDESFAQFSVRDNGLGIPSESLPRIFERFYRVDVSRSRQLGGTGLGLAIVKHGVERHGGKVWVDSLVGIGSTFYFQIPTFYYEKKEFSNLETSVPNDEG